MAVGYIYKKRMLRANEKTARMSGKQLKVQRQIAADTAAQVQMQAAQLELQKQQVLTAERHRLEALAATYVAEGTMTRAEADDYVALEWVNFTVPPAKASNRILPTVFGFPRSGFERPREAGWYRADGIARYWGGTRWTLDSMPIKQAKALVVQEWEGAGDRAMAEGVPQKSSKVAGLLAIFLGAFGVHRMYLGDVLLGIFLALLCVISMAFLFAVPTLILGVIEGILLLKGARGYVRDSRGLPLAA